MRPFAWLTALGLSAALLSPASAWGKDEAKPEAKSESGCGGFGTSVEFFDTPSEAAKQAAKKEKLVFVLHVSGNFEDPRFT
jgi:hypothetical protein